MKRERILASRYLQIYAQVLICILVVVGAINLLVDPLWYGAGNRLTGINPPWNERIEKTNLLLQQSPKTYDCLIFGTSRTTLLDASALENNRCFNYAFSSGDPEEFVNYAKYAKANGIQIRKIYVEIDPEHLNIRNNPQTYEPVQDPLPIYQAYLFSWDVLRLSLQTLTQDYSFVRLYDRQFRGVVAENAPSYEPEFDRDQPTTCDLTRVRPYQELQAVFPDATVIGFVAPMSAWLVFNTRYAPQLLNCQLAGIHQISQIVGTVYDFSLPSSITTRTNNTYDGNHYYPKVYERVANVLEERTSGFGVRVSDYALSDYQSLFRAQITAFLQQPKRASV